VDLLRDPHERSDRPAPRRRRAVYHESSQRAARPPAHRFGARVDGDLRARSDPRAARRLSPGALALVLVALAPPPGGRPPRTTSNGSPNPDESLRMDAVRIPEYSRRRMVTAPRFARDRAHEQQVVRAAFGRISPTTPWRLDRAAAGWLTVPVERPRVRDRSGRILIPPKTVSRGPL
jgi:hypothetical protein